MYDLAVSTLSFLNAYQGAITALATVILTLTTIVYAWHTSVLARENRLLRKAGTEPDVVAYLAQHPRHRTALEFVLGNVGRGPAYDVSFKIVSGGDDFAAHEVLGIARLHSRFFRKKSRRESLSEWGISASRSQGSSHSP
jgi:hypothetical protein